LTAFLQLIINLKS